MSANLWIFMITVVIVGTIYVYKLTDKIVEERIAAGKKDERYTVEELFRDYSAFTITCIVFFGPFAIVTRKLIQKVRGQ